MTATPLYAALLTFLFVWLSLNVIKLRQRFNIRLGDGNNATLRAAISAQANAAQYIPIALILLLLLELNHAHVLLLHVFGLALLAGRIVHARAIQKNHIPSRVRGIQLTFLALIGSAVANLFFLVF